MPPREESDDRSWSVSGRGGRGEPPSHVVKMACLPTLGKSSYHQCDIYIFIVSYISLELSLSLFSFSFFLSLTPRSLPSNEPHALVLLHGKISSKAFADKYLSLSL